MVHSMSPSQTSRSMQCGKVGESPPKVTQFHLRWKRTLLKGFFLEKDESIVSPFSAGKGRTGILIVIDTTLEQVAVW